MEEGAEVLWRAGAGAAQGSLLSSQGFGGSGVKCLVGHALSVEPECKNSDMTVSEGDWVLGQEREEEAGLTRGDRKRG